MCKKMFAMLGISALLCVTKVHAQLYVGVEAGANRNYLITNASDKPFFGYQPSNGYSIGIPVRYQFPSLSWFGGIEAIPTYVQKNYRIQRTEAYSGEYQQTDNNYLELPVVAQFRFGGKLNKHQSLYGILNLGGFAGYWLNGHVQGTTLSPMDLVNYQTYDESYTFNSTRDNRFEYGGIAGVGLQYVLNKKYVISVEGRYNATMSDQQKNYSIDQAPRYNDTYSVMASVQYQLPVLKLHGHKSSNK